MLLQWFERETRRWLGPVFSDTPTKLFPPNKGGHSKFERSLAVPTGTKLTETHDAANGQNPAPVGRWIILLLIGLNPSRLVHDLAHLESRVWQVSQKGGKKECPNILPTVKTSRTPCWASCVSRPLGPQTAALLSEVSLPFQLRDPDPSNGRSREA